MDTTQQQTGTATQSLTTHQTRNALWALMLLVPVPSLGALAGMWLWPDTVLGASLFTLSKVWLVGLPLLWHRFIDGQPFSASPVRLGGMGVGLLSGLAIFTAITATYLLLGERLIDIQQMRAQLQGVGLLNPSLYLLMAAYWIGVNSVLEEMVWRWFVVSKSLPLFGRGAALCAALFFTLHHIVALKLYFSWPATLLCATGVFIGGLIWSWSYARYRSIWPGYLSHALADLAIFLIGWQLLFG